MMPFITKIPGTHGLNKSVNEQANCLSNQIKQYKQSFHFAANFAIFSD